MAMKIYMVRIGNLNRPGSRIVEIKAKNSDQAVLNVMRHYPYYDDVRSIGTKPSRKLNQPGC